MKLYDRKPLYTQLVDKYKVRKYISETIGEEYLIPLIGVWDNFDDINFDKLPNKFVLKCNHDSGGLIICKDKSKLNIEESRRKINRSLKTNYYYMWREWPYKEIKAKIICEEYLINENGGIPTDYKFYCFNGKPMYCQVVRGRYVDHTIDFYDIDWNLMKFTNLKNGGIPYKHSKYKYKKPIEYSKMLQIAKTLSTDFAFVRVDLYLSNKKIYFGELTFYPFAGFDTLDLEEWNIKFGDMITLP